MRAAAIVVAILVLSACAEEKLAVSPPKGVDFSGQWKINEADSDDPQHLAQVANGTASNNNSPNTPPQGGRRGRGGVAGAPGGGLQGPAAPPVGIMSASLRWPGKTLDIKQVAGVVAFTSDGRNRVCQPGTGAGKKHRHHDDDDSRDRDAMPSGRDAPQPICGWSERTLVVERGADPDEERAPYEEDYSLSEDGARLIEVVMFKGGRSDGYTLSRAWDRVQK
jgi:hypothetical protein